ncbi:hypothetical protein SARC_11421 [Sphaeroforma arctica JP610]|uniref:Uncharacterized protein n=1 Tax=Sphaeroforma arctica JP610 TaxID=667725 RepID=A0A0L0FHZ7_9EUKA|nr:hypothetical protein SARC_11421 [Sphaeroforma arctica JP610]KNC76066.1 hypothetical protein SARC_11421 [Sphaeroforma arctica JP610]|eukprot:XP_014149968.1 hypothetical protein SARC_11421 [Sphaeroforma arctica JP610]
MANPHYGDGARRGITGWSPDLALCNLFLGQALLIPDLLAATESICSSQARASHRSGPSGHSIMVTDLQPR